MLAATTLGCSDDGEGADGTGTTDGQEETGADTDTGTDTGDGTDTDDDTDDLPEALCEPSTLDEVLVIEGESLTVRSGPCGDVAFQDQDESEDNVPQEILAQGLVRPDGTIEALTGAIRTTLFGPAGVTLMIHSSEDADAPWTLRELDTGAEFDLGPSETRGYLRSAVEGRGELAWVCNQGQLSIHHPEHNVVADQDIACSSVVGSLGVPLLAFADTDRKAWWLDADTGETHEMPDIEAITELEQDDRDDRFWIDYDGELIIHIEQTEYDWEGSAVLSATGYTLFDRDADTAAELAPYSGSLGELALPSGIIQAPHSGALVSMWTGIGALWVLDVDTKEMKLYEDQHIPISTPDGRTLFLSQGEHIERLRGEDLDTFDNLGEGQLNFFVTLADTIEDPSFVGAWSPGDVTHNLFNFWTEENGWLPRHSSDSEPTLLRATGEYALVGASYFEGEFDPQAEPPTMGLHAVRRSDGTLETHMISDIWLEDTFELTVVDAQRSLVTMELKDSGELALFDHASGELTVISQDESESIPLWVDVHATIFGRVRYEYPGTDRLIITPFSAL